MKKPFVIAGGIVGLVAIAIVAIVAIQLLRSDDPNLATEAPVIGATGATGSTGATGASGADVSPTHLHRPAPPSPRERGASSSCRAESEAKYVVRESLRGLSTNAVGTTRTIEGEVYLSEDGLETATPSSFRVDLNTLTSDEGMRDNYIKRNTLQTSQFQYAEFVIDEITGFPDGYVENTQVELTLSGTLTIRDIEKPVTWTVLARQAGDTLTATADTDIRFDDFGMSPPSVPIATAEAEIHIQVVLVAREA